MKEYVILCGSNGLAERLFERFLSKFSDIVEYIDRKNLTTRTKDTSLKFISETNWHNQKDVTVISETHFRTAMYEYLATH